MNIHLDRVVLFHLYRCVPLGLHHLSVLLDPVGQVDLEHIWSTMTIVTSLLHSIREHDQVHPFHPRQPNETSESCIHRDNLCRRRSRANNYLDTIPNDWTWMTTFAFRSHFALKILFMFERMQLVYWDVSYRKSSKAGITLSKRRQ
jgi:hypothetical protein